MIATLGGDLSRTLSMRASIILSSFLLVIFISFLYICLVYLFITLWIMIWPLIYPLISRHPPDAQLGFGTRSSPCGKRQLPKPLRFLALGCYSAGRCTRGRHPSQILGTMASLADSRTRSGTTLSTGNIQSSCRLDASGSGQHKRAKLRLWICEKIDLRAMTKGRGFGMARCHAHIALLQETQRGSRGY